MVLLRHIWDIYVHLKRITGGAEPQELSTKGCPQCCRLSLEANALAQTQGLVKIEQPRQKNIVENPYYQQQVFLYRRALLGTDPTDRQSDQAISPSTSYSRSRVSAMCLTLSGHAQTDLSQFWTHQSKPYPIAKAWYHGHSLRVRFERPQYEDSHRRVLKGLQ